MENAENALDATNSLADQLLQSLTNDTAFKGGGVHKRKPTEFVAKLFDQFADTFDDKLVNTTWWGCGPAGVWGYSGCGVWYRTCGTFLASTAGKKWWMHHRKCLILLHNAPYRKGVDYQHHHQIQTILLLDFLSHHSSPATSTKHSVVFFIIRNADQSSDPALCSGGPTVRG